MKFKHLFPALCASAFFLFNTANAQIISTIAGNGTWGYAGDGGMATSAELGTLSSLAVDASGNVYIGDEFHGVIRKINASGVITTIAGTGTVGYSGDGGPATAAGLTNPIAIIFDSAGNLIFSDYNANRVRKIDATTGIISTIAGTGAHVSYPSPNGDGGSALAASITNPTGLAFDHSWNLYVSEQENFRIRKINSAGIISTVVGDVVPSSAIFDGDGGPATAAHISNASGIAFDASNNLILCDMGNLRLRKVDAAGIINTIAGSGTCGNYREGDGGAALGANICVGGTNSFTIDNANNIFFTDNSNCSIRKISNTGMLSTIAGFALPGVGCLYSFGGDGGDPMAAILNGPSSITMDVNGNILFIDHENARVRKISPATTGISTTTGQAKKLHIFPNPNNGSFSIKLDQTANSSMSLRITDMIGHTVFTSTINSNTSNIVANLPAGNYLVIVSGNTGVLTDKIIVE